jgi:Rieske Fe-S protein
LVKLFEIMGNRRDFLGKACAACGAVFLSGAAAAVLESCGTSKEAAGAASKPAGYVVNNGVLTIPLDDLGDAAKVISAKGAPKDLYIAKNPDGTYKVLLLKCPHMGGSVFQENQMFKCGLHGSTFDLSGKVTKGPAKDNLPVYKAQVNGTNLVVQIG